MSCLSPRRKTWARFLIEGPAGNLLLKDVATVATDHQPLIGDALLSNEAELLLVIEKVPGDQHDGRDPGR